jgi:hypothetical protein
VLPENIEWQGYRGMAILSGLQTVGLDRCFSVCDRATLYTSPRVTSLRAVMDSSDTVLNEERHAWVWRVQLCEGRHESRPVVL